MADVHFVVGQPGRTQRLPGHRVRILASSEVALKGWKMNKQAATQAGPLLLISYKLEKKSSFLFASHNETDSFCAPPSLPHHVSFRDSPQLFM